MKFAKELERDAVPEWRIKYLNYKAGKKYVKSIARAVHRANATPKSIGQLTPSYFTSQTLRTALEDRTLVPDEASPRHRVQSPERGSSITRPEPISTRKAEEEPLRNGSEPHYGSFIPTPPMASPLAQDPDNKGEFELPGPALQPEPVHTSKIRTAPPSGKGIVRESPRRSTSDAALPTSDSARIKSLPHRRLNGDSPSQLRRLFSHSGTKINMTRKDFSSTSMGMQTFDLVRERENDFYRFMESELEKVDGFYRFKEEQAGRRLAILRDQLHEMRNRRIQEIAEESQRELSQSYDDGERQDKSTGWISPLKARFFPPGPNSMAFSSMPRTPLLSSGDPSRDYSRRPEEHEVSYRTAKRKLKLALQEFYRGLELLKSFALLNRTAFRKINKKFDKAINARPPFRFMTEKVNQSWFVQSDVLESHIKAVEDLYARYFERGNHKLAAGKLRSLAKKKRDESGSSFLNGLLIGTGLVFSVQGLIYGAQLLFHEDGEMRQRTSYLMQIYAGYFLMLLLFSLFCINCFIWDTHKINYPFIFEFDQRHQLDWRRIAEFPSFFLLVLGISMWTNFSRYGSDEWYLWYPVVLIGFTVVIILFPFPYFAHRTRKWLAYSHWRLLLAGIYPVEFRDFFLGDMYCSLTYATANAELFFCLYAHQWDNPPQCNSSHSRVLGFLTALPPIWRFLQCLRRYRDTRNIFPHLVNCGKYTMSIMAAITLSIYRIERTDGNLGLFITFALVNAAYCSVWDLFMDFSLLQTSSRHIGLRDILALKKRWPYYTIMVVDPILRFSWIFYAIFTHDAQHSTLVSFLVGLAEVLRRGAWSIFRVENEHCANVAQYKASRDVPLPYRIEPLLRASAESSPEIQPQDDRASSTAVESNAGVARRRTEPPTPRSFSKILAEAHLQDFVKKRKPGVQGQEAQADEGPSDDDAESESEADMMIDAAEAAELRRRGGDEE